MKFWSKYLKLISRSTNLDLTKMKTFIFVLLCGVLATTSSCVSVDKRTPSSAARSLIQDLADLKAKAESKSLNDTNCHDYFSEELNLFNDERIHEYGFDDLQSFKDIIRGTWQARLSIHAHLSDYHQSCLTELRQLFYNLRSLEDMADLAYYKEVPLSAADFKGEVPFQDQPIPLVDNDFYDGYLGSNGEVANRQNVLKGILKNGDVLETSGPSDFAAILATMPEYPGFLDHLVYLHHDDQHGFETIESYATPQGGKYQGTGVQKYDINFALKNGNPRILALRLKPEYSALATKAVDDFYHLVTSGPNIGYDYKMVVKDPTKMTCTSVPYWALRNASAGKFIIPEQKSHLRPGLSPIYDETGLTQAPLLTAADLELDSRFDLLLEFRDHRLTEDVRIRHSAARAIEKWMIEDGYRLRPTVQTFFLDAIVFPLHLGSLVKVPPGAPKGFVVTLNELNQTVEVLVQQLKVEQAKRRQKHQWSMSLKEMADFLENYRLSELQSCLNPNLRSEGPLLRAFAPQNLACRPPVQQ